MYLTQDEYRKLSSADKRVRTEKPRKESEFENQRECFRVLRLESNLKPYPFLKFIYAVPNFSMRSRTQAGRAKAEGMVSGVFDIDVPFTRYGYSGLRIENKVKPNTLTPQQKEFAEHFRRENYLVKICWSADECLTAIENYLEIRLKRV